MEPDPSRPLDRAPEAGARRLPRSLLLAFLALQLLVPLTYYLRDDPYDERFAWRMFSAVRLHTCETRVEESHATPGGVSVLPVDLARAVHVAWLDHMGRNRRRVIEAFLARRCLERDVVRVRLVNECTTADDRVLPPLEYALDCLGGSRTDPPSLRELERRGGR